jgi:hypothetical protein
VQGAGQLEGQLAPAAAGTLRAAPARQGVRRWRWRRAGGAVAAGAHAMLADFMALIKNVCSEREGVFCP